MAKNIKKYDFDININRISIYHDNIKNMHIGKEFCANPYTTSENLSEFFSQKWDGQEGDYIPLWVADMDFKAPEKILNSIRERLDHGIFGYTRYDYDLLDVIVDYYKKNYNYEIKKEWIVWVPSVMPGCNLACRLAEGKILYNTPMYPHIRRLHTEASCKYQEIPLIRKDNIYTFDWDRMEKEIDDDVKAFVLCNPHNPVGRVYTQEELDRLSKFILDHDLLLISDEIHSQLLFEGNHIPAFSIDDEMRERSITFTSAGKTYNIASIPFAFAIIPNNKIRDKYSKLCNGLFSTHNSLTMEVIKTAYTKCDDWREELLDYLKCNRDYLEDRISNIKGLSITHNQATYLAWIDVTNLNLENPWEFFRREAGINFSNGLDFGAKGFLRLNFACTRSLLEEALNRIEYAVSKLNL